MPCLIQFNSNLNSAYTPEHDPFITKASRIPSILVHHPMPPKQQLLFNSSAIPKTAVHKFTQPCSLYTILDDARESTIITKMGLSAKTE